jgi:hypothetical protein
MSHHPHDGSADEALSASLLRFIEEDRIPELRQALSGFNHRCRNMLNGLSMGFYLTRRATTGPIPQRWDDLNRTYQEIERLFDLLQSIYRSMELSPSCRPFQTVVDERGRSWRMAFEAEGATLAIRPPAREVAGEFDGARIADALDGFVAWRASRLGPGGRATLTWGTTKRHFELCWDESSPTVAPPRTGSPQDPVAALASTLRSLSLPRLARVVAEHRGRLSWTPGPAAEARIRWPLTPATSAAAGPHRPTALAPSLG